MAEATFLMKEEGADQALQNALVQFLAHACPVAKAYYDWLIKRWPIVRPWGARLPKRRE